MLIITDICYQGDVLKVLCWSCCSWNGFLFCWILADPWFMHFTCSLGYSNRIAKIILSILKTFPCHVARPGVFSLQSLIDNHQLFSAETQSHLDQLAESHAKLLEAWQDKAELFTQCYDLQVSERDRLDSIQYMHGCGGRAFAAWQAVWHHNTMTPWCQACWSTYCSWHSGGLAVCDFDSYAYACGFESGLGHRAYGTFGRSLHPVVLCPVSSTSDCPCAWCWCRDLRSAESCMPHLHSPYH